MNFAIVHNSIPQFGGIENQILLLIDHLKSKNRVIFITNCPKSEISIRLQHMGIKVYSCSGSLLPFIYFISRICQKEKIDILQAHTFDSGIKIRLIKLFYPRLKIVVRVHTYIKSSWISDFKKRIYYLIDSLTSPLVSKFIINGGYLLDEIKLNTHINVDKLVSVIDGIKEIIPLKNLSLPQFNKPFQLLMIANIVPHKGHDILIKGIKLLKDKGISCSCRIVGAIDIDINYYNSLRLLSRELSIENQIIFLGFQSKIRDFLERTDIVVLPSDSEGTPNCIMEGMSAKRLVIVSDTGGVKEMVKNGVTGFIHKPYSYEDFAEAIEDISKMDKSELQSIVNNGYEFWSSNLSRTAMVKSFERIYNELDKQ